MNDGLRGGHASDEVLAAWVAGTGAEPAIAAHVAGCPACQVRAARWQALLEPVGRALRQPADAQFSESFLARQRTEVMRRLRGQPRARVLRFPMAGDDGRRPPQRLQRNGTRWVAAAAVMGLLVGGGAARWFDPHQQRAFTTPGARASSPALPGRSPETSQESAVADEAFLVELDVALVSPAPGPLRVLDALTPEGDPGSRPR
jgi:anti-sigma factor RsiW